MSRLATVDGLVAAAAEKNPDGTALVDATRRLTFAELQHEVACATQVLVDLGTRRGSTVAASGVNGIDVLTAFLATMRLGARWVGINRALAGPEREMLLTHCRARVFLTEQGDPPLTLTWLRTVLHLGPLGSWQEAVTTARPRWSVTPVDPLAAAAIAYTSGTTGRPKGVVHSQHNITLPGRYLITTADFDATAVIGVCLPLTILNLIAVAALPALFAGRPCILVPKVEAGTVAHWIEHEGITNMSIPPPVLYDLATRPDIDAESLASLRCPRTGGAELPDTTRRLFAQRFGRQVLGTYGLTEAPTVVAVEARGEPHVQGASGKVVPYLEVRIVGEAGRGLPSGETGEICLAPSTSGAWAGVWTPMLGYWRRPAPTQVAMVGGVFHTGDLGSLDAEGNLFVQDRKSDMINRGGANVYPAEIERVLRELPGLVHCAVVGIPDPRLGERVAVAVQPAPDAVVTRDGLLEFCGQRLARYKIPEVIHFVDELPRNSMGKVVRPTVRDAIVSSLTAGVHA